MSSLLKARGAAAICALVLGGCTKSRDLSSLCASLSGEPVGGLRHAGGGVHPPGWGGRRQPDEPELPRELAPRERRPARPLPGLPRRGLRGRRRRRLLHLAGLPHPTRGARVLRHLSRRRRRPASLDRSPHPARRLLRRLPRRAGDGRRPRPSHEPGAGDLLGARARGRRDARVERVAAALLRRLLPRLAESHLADAAGRRPVRHLPRRPARLAPALEPRGHASGRAPAPLLPAQRPRRATRTSTASSSSTPASRATPAMGTGRSARPHPGSTDRAIPLRAAPAPTRLTSTRRSRAASARWSTARPATPCPRPSRRRATSITRRPPP